MIANSRMTTWITWCYSIKLKTKPLEMLSTMRSLLTSLNVLLDLLLPFFTRLKIIQSTFLTPASGGLFMSPKYLNQFSFVFSSINVTPIFSYIQYFQVIFFLVWPYIHLNILIYTSSTLFSCYFKAQQHSLLWSIARSIRIW